MLENVKFITGGKLISKGKWIHQARTINSTEIIVVTDGVAHIFVGEQKYSVEAGQVLRILPGERHGGFMESENVSFFWLHFSDCAPDGLPPRICRPKSFERIELLSKELLHYANTEGYPGECADYMLRVLILEIVCGSQTAEERKLISEIKEFIRRNRKSAVKTSEIADHFGYNEDYLNRLFKKQCSVGIKKYVDSVRLEGIKRELLIGSRSLTDISYSFGFSDYKYFLKFFKYHEGISPTRYRETYYNMHTN